MRESRRGRPGHGVRGFTLALALALAASVPWGPARAAAPQAESAAPAPLPPTPERTARALELFESAERHLARNDFDQRRVALRELEQATLLDPNPMYELALARAYYQAGFLKNARLRYERVARLAPDNAQGRFGLGQVWRRDWLKYLDRGSLARSVEHFSAAARLDPRACEAWLMLTPLLVEQGDLRAAGAAAERAFEADTGRGEARLALAYTSWRLGHTDLAASAFASALRRVPVRLRDRLEDIAPLASEKDTAEYRRLTPRERPAFAHRFWKDLDPDLATPENEAQLEYWSRVAHAWFLFYNPKRRDWDERGELYVRYGPPERADYNPVNARLSTMRRGSSYGSQIVSTEFPANVLQWDYPSLGMSVTMIDILLSEHYMLPAAMAHDPDPLPDADSLKKRGGVFAAGSGRAVFPTMPPGSRPLALRGVVARFEAEAGGRVLAQLEVPGAPADSLWAEWVVLDSARHEVARAGRALAPSACAPASRRVAEFSGELPPGDYVVGLSVRGRDGRRGAWRAEVPLRQAADELALSDLVIACGPPEVGSGPPVRIAPNPAATIGPRDPLTAYFEIYHLAPGQDGQGRFLYEYSVRGAEKDPRIWIQRLLQPRRELPSMSAQREEENPGALRRQFVTIPVQTLPPGRYRLDIRVRDLIAQIETTRTVEFVKTGAALQ